MYQPYRDKFSEDNLRKDHPFNSFIEGVNKGQVGIYKRSFPYIGDMPCKYPLNCLPYYSVEGLFLRIDPQCDFDFNHQSRYVYIPPVYEPLYLTIMDQLGYQVNDKTISENKNKPSNQHNIQPWLIGSTGTGKSYFIYYMAYRLLTSGWDVTVYNFRSCLRTNDHFPEHIGKSTNNSNFDYKRIAIFDGCSNEGYQGLSLRIAYNQNIHSHNTEYTNNVFLSMPTHSHITSAGVSSCPYTYDHLDLDPDLGLDLNSGLHPIITYLSYIIHPGLLRLLGHHHFDFDAIPPLLVKVTETPFDSKTINSTNITTTSIPQDFDHSSLVYTILDSPYIYKNEPNDSERLYQDLSLFPKDNNSNDNNTTGNTNTYTLTATNNTSDNNNTNTLPLTFTTTTHDILNQTQNECNIHCLGHFIIPNTHIFTPQPLFDPAIQTSLRCPCKFSYTGTSTNKNEELSFHCHLPISTYNELLQQIFCTKTSASVETNYSYASKFRNSIKFNGNYHIYQEYEDYYYSTHPTSYYMYSSEIPSSEFPTSYNIIYSTPTVETIPHNSNRTFSVIRSNVNKKSLYKNPGVTLNQCRY